jgi:hypothetical protein
VTLFTEIRAPTATTVRVSVKIAFVALVGVTVEAGTDDWFFPLLLFGIIHDVLSQSPLNFWLGSGAIFGFSFLK